MKRTPIKKHIREIVKARFGNHCGYCGTPTERIFIDHMKPVHAGGTDDQDNLMPACFTCNNWKGGFTVEEFRKEISKQVARARKYSRNFMMAEKFLLVKEVVRPVIFYFEQEYNANA